MRTGPDGSLHLTYCTNIHAADGWTAVDETIRRVAPALKARLSPDAPFGLGLRLSARDAAELVDGRLEEFRDFLRREGLYVAIINGFPYGRFHRAAVKADVYAPDWRREARATYTATLIDILAELLPEGLDGGVSTVPLSYKAWMRTGDAEGRRAITTHLVRVAAKLVRLRRDRGLLIHLDVEPEPDCLIENTEEALGFFEHGLLVDAAPDLATALGVSRETARRDLLDHVRICFDCCHFSVEHEDPIIALDRLRSAGIQIGRIQLSSALRVSMPADRDGASRVSDRLRRFADTTYLHQVIRRHAGGFEHFADLDEALARGGPGDWRVHFHVPLFTNEYDGLGSTQDDVRAVLGWAAVSGATRHLEIETYTWDVLPAGLKLDLVESIAREYTWVLGSLAEARSAPAES